MSTTESSAGSIMAVGRSRGWRIAFGAVTALVGLLMLLWPDATLLTVAVLLGLQLIVAGIFRIVTAFAQDAESGAARALFLVLGLLLIIAGVLCLRAPVRTVGILVLLFGLTWVVSGVIEMFQAFGGGGGRAFLFGLISLLAGIVVLFYPVTSVVVMIWLFGIALVAIGIAAIVDAVAEPKSRSATRMSGAAGPVTARW